MCETSDVVVNFEHEILRGRILFEPKYGILSFHSGDVRKYRGRPAAFWQFINGENEIGVTLQRLTDDLDGGFPIVIKSADISDASTYWEVKVKQNRLYDDMLVEGIRLIQDPDFSIERPDELGDLTRQEDIEVWRNTGRLVLKDILGRVTK